MCQGKKGEKESQAQRRASIRRLEDDMKKSKEKLITATRNNTDNTRTDRTKITRKQKWEEKQLYRYFKRQTTEILH